MASELWPKRSSTNRVPDLTQIRKSDPSQVALNRLWRPIEDLPIVKGPAQLDVLGVCHTRGMAEPDARPMDSLRSDNGLGRNVSGGTQPRLSWGRSLL
jgi:hypothetical protein